MNTTSGWTNPLCSVRKTKVVANSYLLMCLYTDQQSQQSVQSQFSWTNKSAFLLLFLTNSPTFWWPIFNSQTLQVFQTSCHPVSDSERDRVLTECRHWLTCLLDCNGWLSASLDVVPMAHRQPASEHCSSVPSVHAVTNHSQMVNVYGLETCHTIQHYATFCQAPLPPQLYQKILPYNRCKCVNNSKGVAVSKFYDVWPGNGMGRQYLEISCELWIQSPTS